MLLCNMVCTIMKYVHQLFSAHYCNNLDLSSPGSLQPKSTIKWNFSETWKPGCKPKDCSLQFLQAGMGLGPRPEHCQAAGGPSGAW